MLLRQLAFGDLHLGRREARRILLDRFRLLLQQDLLNVERGVYPSRLLFQLPLVDYARRLPGLARDLPKVFQRMRAGDYKDLPEDVDLSSYPSYYRRTFHWQTGGYLSQHSARLYDVGVEFLFGGTGDVMRRQGLVPLQDTARLAAPRILDLACGTGRMLAQLRVAMPHAVLTGVDLSPYYLDEARRQLARMGGAPIDMVAANAERLPQSDAEFDALTCVYLFHELPRNARRGVYREMFRVLRPGGRVVVLDSVQLSDAPEIVCFLERFQDELHEPFHRDYARDDLANGLSEAGFEVDIDGDPAYVTKVVAGRKPLH